MKKYKNVYFIFSLFAMLLFAGCQKEEQEFIDETDQDTFTANSNLVNLLSQSSQNIGDFDDIIDNNSCAEVVLPVTVIANGQEVIIENEDDYDIVEDIFDQFPNDDDTLEIIFPIQVILANFQTVTVNSQEELNIIIAACDDDDPSNDGIACIDFVYPITFFIYDSDQQQIGSETVESDIELFLFLLNLDENLFLSIDYPVTVIVNGTAVEVNSNEELEALIQQADCDDDDDINNEEFTQNLTDGVWYITTYFDDTDQTGLYTGYEFMFNTDQTAQADNGSNTVPGTWNLTSGSSPDLELFFGNNDPFDELDDDWDIIEYNADIIRLKDVSGGDGSTDYLTFERTPNTGNNEDLNAFIGNLTDGSWFVNVLEEDNDPNEACDYNGYEFVFMLNGTATATSTANTVNGVWTATGTGNNLDLILNFENSGSNDPFEDLNDDWDVQLSNSQTIELIDVSGGNGGTDILIFGRNPADCGSGGDVTAFTNQLTDGDWFVTLLEEDNDPDESCNYVDYEFNFYTDGTVVAISTMNTINGLWTAVSSSGGIDLALDFDFSVNPNFEDLNDEDWEVLEFDNNIIRLRDVSGGNGGTDLLNFGRSAPSGCDTTGAEDLENILIDGTWIVASYDEDGDDQTSDYYGYVFDFMTGGAVLVTGPSTINGNWSVIPSGSDLEMLLNFGTAVPLDEFNDDDWEVIDVTNNRVEIRDVSGGNGGIDTLVFEKL